MFFLPVFILALVQGITEFLPISSSGHLVLTHSLLGDMLLMTDIEEKTLDIAVHVGTLLAVILYFRTDVFDLAKGLADMLFRRTKSQSSLKLLNVILASLPVIIVGMAIVMIDMAIFDSLQLMAWMTLIFGIVLYFADRTPQSSHKTVENMTMKEAMVYGIAQALALVPGVSRSGITMTAGRFMGYSRIEAARFSLLLSIIAISGAGVLSTLYTLESGLTHHMLLMLFVGAALSFVTAYLAILLMMRWLKSASFTPFAIYRVVLGILLLGLLYGGVIPQDM